MERRWKVGGKVPLDRGIYEPLALGDKRELVGTGPWRAFQPFSPLFFPWRTFPVFSPLFSPLKAPNRLASPLFSRQRPAGRPGYLAAPPLAEPALGQIGTILATPHRCRRSLGPVWLARALHYAKNRPLRRTAPGGSGAGSPWHGYCRVKRRAKYPVWSGAALALARSRPWRTPSGAVRRGGLARFVLMQGVCHGAQAGAAPAAVRRGGVARGLQGCKRRAKGMGH